MQMIKPAEHKDLHVIADKLRMADSIEIAAQHGIGMSNRQALSRALMVSWRAWTVWKGKTPVCMFGVAPAGPSHSGIGSPWMLATDEFETLSPHYIVRESRKYVKMMLDEFPYLYNFVYHANHKSVKWLEMIGFKVYRDSPRRFKNGMFYPFDLAREEEQKDV